MGEKQTVVPLYLNSKDRYDIKDSTTNFTIKLRKTLRNITSIAVSDVGIPRTFTNINKNNNKLVFIFTSADGNINLNITIISKQYTESTLATALQTAFNTNSVSTTIGLVWSITFDSETSYFNINVQYATGVYTTWGIQIIYTPLVDILGIGSGGTTTLEFNTTANTNLSIPTNRISLLLNNLCFNITSTALTANINTSYILSLAKSFNINNSNNTLILTSTQELKNYTRKLDNPSGAIGITGYGTSISITNSTLAIGAPIYNNNIGAVIIYNPTNQTISAGSFDSTEGSNISLSADGLTLITGAPYDWNNTTITVQPTPLPEYGAAYIYTWNGVRWSLMSKITPITMDEKQRFGSHVAISADGNTVAISSVLDTSIYVRNINVWTLQKTMAYRIRPLLSANGNVMAITYSSNTEIWSRVGSIWTYQMVLPIIAYAISDDGTIITSGGTGGDIKIYRYSGSWTLDTTIPDIGNDFGYAVSLSGDGNTIAIGVPLLGDGVVLVYTYSGAWSLHSTLTDTSTDAKQGSSISLTMDGKKIAIGGIGANNGTGKVWVWTLSLSNVWSINYSKILTSSLSNIGYGTSNAMTTNGKIVLVGAPLDRQQSGAVWLYNKNVDKPYLFDEGTKIYPSSTTGVDTKFGYSVAISGDNKTFIVGAPNDWGGGTDNLTASGAAFIYTLIGGSWELQSKLIGTGTFTTTLHQGFSVAISYDGNTVAIGSPESDTVGGSIGRVYIFVRTGTTWTEEGKLVGTGYAGSPSFGWAVALSADGNTCIVGAPGAQLATDQTGGAWIFKKNMGTWTETSILQSPLSLGNIGLVGYKSGYSIATTEDCGIIVLGAPAPIVGNEGALQIWMNGVKIQTVLATGPAIDIGNTIAMTASTIVAGVSISTATLDGTGGFYRFNKTGNIWYQQGTLISGEKETIYNDTQGSSISIDQDGIVLLGGLGRNDYHSRVWLYIPYAIYTINDSISIDMRAFTIFDLINELNTLLRFDNVYYTATFTTDIVTLTIFTYSNVTAKFIVSTGSSFNFIIFPSTIPSSTLTSTSIDFNINNNIIKNINTSSTTTAIIYDTTPTILFRKYPSGYSLTDTSFIDIQLRDERDRIVDLNGADWMLTIYATIFN